MPASLTVGGLMDAIVPVTKFNQGCAGRIFEEVRESGSKIVVKNNTPIAVIISPEAYKQIEEELEDYQLLLEAERRLKSCDETKLLSQEEVMRELGISHTELDACDVEID